MSNPRRPVFALWPRRTAAGLLALSACTEASSSARELDAAAERQPDASRQRDAAPVARDAGADARAATNVAQLGALRDEQVFTAAPARRVLYSWTTEEQARELRQTPVLLTRSQRADGTATKLSQALAALAADADPLASLLSGPDFQKGRFGWPSAWPTLRGWPGESYGTALLRIVLKPDAWIARLMDRELQVFDALNQRVELEAVLRTPERIAAVYHVAVEPGEVGSCGSFVDCAPGTFREYFVNNERMVEEWSLGTETILGQLERGRTLVAELLARANAGTWYTPDSCEFSGALQCVWRSADNFQNSNFSTAYLQSLAIASDYYVPSEANLQALDDALAAARFELAPFVHRP